MNTIEIKNITKGYDNIIALDNVSISFSKGKIYGLLGRNGAGKSTLINIIANRILPSSGEVLIDELSNKENMAIHEKIFCVSDADLFDPSFKIKVHFKWTNRFYDSFNIDKAYELAKKFDLDPNKKLSSLSKGYKSIFKVIMALSLDVPYVIYDEPVLGLDANHRELFYKLLLNNYENSNQTIIVATHLIEEVANIIEEVVLIDKGKILLQEDVPSLLERGYCVSGSKEDVDNYCVNKNVLDYDELANLRVAYILDDKPPLTSNSNLQFSPINLQKLFVKITKKGGL